MFLPCGTSVNQQKKFQANRTSISRDITVQRQPCRFNNSAFRFSRLLTFHAGENERMERKKAILEAENSK